DDEAIMKKASEMLDNALTKAEVEEVVNKINKEVEDKKSDPEKELKEIKEQAKEEIDKLDLSQVQKDKFKSLLDEAKDKNAVNKVKEDAQELLDAIIDA
ncbi:GA module-containing protein, partial [Anaerococcus sp. HMSC075B03]|uniref:GA module-containing protein n=1 Tax=Anaerococcus sp. HMSC075B03 TaxID=1739537 RepID=UPI001C573EA3